MLLCECVTMKISTPPHATNGLWKLSDSINKWAPSIIDSLYYFTEPHMHKRTASDMYPLTII